MGSSSGNGNKGSARGGGGKVEVTYFHKPPDRLRTLLETPAVQAPEPREAGRMGPRDTLRELPAVVSARPRPKVREERPPPRAAETPGPRTTPRERPKAGRRRTTTLEAPAVDEAEASEPRRGRRPDSDGIVRHGVETLGEKRVAEMALFGHHLFEQGKFAEAKKVFEGLVGLGVQDAFPHTMLGILFLADDDSERALALFEAALALEPDELAARVYRAEIHLRREQVDSAVEELRRVVRSGDRNDPFVARARMLLAEAGSGREDASTRRRRR